MRQKSAFPWKNSNQILFGSFLLYDKRNEKLDALMFQPEAHMGSCSAQEPQCVLSLASENRTGACVCVRVWGKGYGLYGKVPPEKSGEVCATQQGMVLRDLIQNQGTCTVFPLIITGGDSSFFFSRRWREGLEDDYLWEAITLNTVKFRKQAPGLIFFKGPF